MDMTVDYMGLRLSNPLIVSACSITGTLEGVTKCAEHKPGAIVLRSLFEEQILQAIEQQLMKDDSYFWYPQAGEYVKDISSDQGAAGYLKLIERSVHMTDLPIIASINCITPREWVQFAKKMESSGAKGLELNISTPLSDDSSRGDEILQRQIEIVQSVRDSVSIPVAVKMSPFFTNLARAAKQFADAGVHALVMFNRFYRTDIDIETLKLTPASYFSAPEEITLTLRWVALLSKRLHCDIAASTGIHDTAGVIKQLLAGANAVQIATTIYKNGFEVISTIKDHLAEWMAKHGYSSIHDFRGKAAQEKKEIATFERVQFMTLSTQEF